MSYLSSYLLSRLRDINAFLIVDRVLEFWCSDVIRVSPGCGSGGHRGWRLRFPHQANQAPGAHHIVAAHLA